MTVVEITPDVIARVPTRDGVELHTEIFLPEGDGPWPAVLTRTPYPDATFPWSKRPVEEYRGNGHAFVIQACRGTDRSGGVWRFMQHEGDDGHDAVEWLASQPWCNGMVGMVGSSYGGSAAWLAAKTKPPHLRAIAPQSPGAWFFHETPYIGGVLFKSHVIAWPRFVSEASWEDIGIDPSTPGGGVDEQFWMSPNREMIQSWHRPDFAEAMVELLEHSTQDAWWERIMLTPESAEIDIPILQVAGFYDADQAGALYNWEMVEANQRSGSQRRHLLVGPWRHAELATGDVTPVGPFEIGEAGRLDLARSTRRFFDAYLKADASAVEELPRRCRLYTTGDGRWHEFPSYPPPNMRPKRLYLHSDGQANTAAGDGRLSFEAPLGEEPADEMLADWQEPVPHVPLGDDGGANNTREDVLVYTSDPLSDEMTLLGPVAANLFAAADAPDFDVILHLEEVLPDGRSINMTGELGVAPFRARYHQGFDREVQLEPDVPVELSFHMFHAGRTVPAGHRLRITIAATAVPWLEPNHHTGEPVLDAVTRRKATERIFHDRDRPSHVVLPVLGSDAP